MISLFFKIKRNKLLFALCIFLLVVLLVDVSSIIFNLIEIIKTGTNSVVLAGGFLAFNIFTISFNGLGLIFIFLYLILSKRKINKIIDKNK